MGAVYRARDAQAGTEVALKHLTDRRHSERFEVEARLLSVLSHPRVVRVLEYFQDETGQYLVMELVEGTDLGAVLKQRGNPGLPLDEAMETSGTPARRSSTCTTSRSSTATSSRRT